MTRKLLYQTQKSYLIYAALTFLLISPFFYFVTEKLYLDDADETLVINKQRFSQQILPSFKIKDIKLWNTFNPDNQISEAIPLKKDSVFSTILFSKLEQEDEPYRIIYSSIAIENRQFLYTNRINLVESEDILFNIALLFIVLILLLLIGVLIITNQMSKQIWQPFYEIINQIEGFEIDKGSLPKFTPTNIEEFNRLNASFEKLISNNLIIYENQREFIDNAAHELQTPLAIFRSQLILLIQRKDLTQGQAEIVGNINQNIDRLIKLNKNLLLLSKIDRHRQIAIEEFSLKELLEKQVLFFNEQAASKHILFTLKINEDILINANKNLTETLFSNLLLNALQHNIENGSVLIELSNNKVTITNTSTEGKISNKKLFNRFAKSNQNQKGNGLGLAIVKKIIDLNNWGISYSFFKNKHQFSILL